MSMRIIGRAEWGARYGRGNDVSTKLPWGEVIIHTEAGAVRKEDWPALNELAAANLSTSEELKLRAIENFHVNTRGWDGIAYSFLIFPDGTIGEGRGWGRSGAHTEGRNSTAAGVCFIGHGDLQPATEAQWAATRWLIAEGIRLGKLRSNPAVATHAKYSLKGKTCPGTLIAPHVQERLAGITATTDTTTVPHTEEFTMDDAATKAFAALNAKLDQKADKAQALRGPDGRVWIVTATGRWHVPDTATLNALVFIGQVGQYGPKGVPQVDDDVLDGIPEF